MSAERARKAQFKARAQRTGALMLALFGCVMLLPIAVDAGQGNSMTPTFPANVTVGDTGTAASVTIRNESTAPEDAATSRICNVGDPGPCAGDEGITVIPVCGQLDSTLTTCSKPDPGVMSIASPAEGALGCFGIKFDVVLADAALGKYRFTPQGGAHVSLAPGAKCQIDFKLGILKLPTVDVEPTMSGVQTAQLASSRLVAQATSKAGQGTGTSFGTTVAPLPPPPPAPPPTPPPPPAPAPLAPSSPPRGTAKITGRSGCVAQDFNVQVNGTQIRRVDFYLDGKKLRTLSTPNVGTSTFRIRVRPGTLSRGTHRIIAKTTFTTSSGTPARSLRVTFSRCARRAPKFTG